MPGMTSRAELPGWWAVSEPCSKDGRIPRLPRLTTVHGDGRPHHLHTKNLHGQDTHIGKTHTQTLYTGKTHTYTDTQAKQIHIQIHRQNTHTYANTHTTTHYCRMQTSQIEFSTWEPHCRQTPAGVGVAGWIPGWQYNHR